jgi:hypothetical protein
MKNTILALALTTAVSSLGMAYYVPNSAERNFREIEAVTRDKELRNTFSGEPGIQSVVRGEEDESGTRYYVRSGKCTAFIRVLPISVALDPSQLETRFEGMACE